VFSRNYAEFYDLFNSDKPYKKEVAFVYRWAGRPHSIFDIGCGTGNYWRHFPKSTHIVGIDRSQAMVDNGYRIIHADAMTFKTNVRFDCATALFDVLNYMPRNDWWANIPVKKGGYFIFDIWDKKKVMRDGFKETFKNIGRYCRKITPVRWKENAIDLKVEVIYIGDDHHETAASEIHTMYLYGQKDIKKFCGKEFEIVDVKPTSRWQTWYKCKKK